jgi:hypothetical protein
MRGREFERENQPSYGFRENHPLNPSTNHLEGRFKTVGKDAYAKFQADVEQTPLSIA